MMNNKTLTGRTALITGGGVGIGHEVAIALVAAGARVAVTYRTHVPDESLISKISGDAAHGVAIQVDGTNESRVHAAIDLAAKELGGIDILVNNIEGLVRRAGIASGCAWPQRS